MTRIRTPLLLAILYLACHLFTNTAIPVPFIDEQFHFKQFLNWHLTRDYTRYDPMITTPPGLYLLPLITYNGGLRVRVWMLRAVNLVYVALIAVVGPKKALVPLLTNPLISFYSCLFYTDIGAVAMSLAYMTLLKQRRQWKYTLLAIVAGSMALLFRQTCIVWIGFALCKVLFERHGTVSFEALRDHLTQIFTTTLLSSLFVLFMVVNGGIAIGDKTHHQATLHLPQLFYCSTFTLFLNAPSLKIKSIFKKNWKPVYALLTVPIVLCCHYGTVMHPYIFTDDRHLVNLLWKHVLVYEEARILLASAVYLPALFTIYYSVASRHGHPMAVSFMVCMACSVIPSPLVEPRYYIQPAIFHYLLAGNKRRRVERRGQVCWNMALATLLFVPLWWTVDKERPEQRFIL
jgi:alpha-1,2-glucosyltransferase